MLWGATDFEDTAESFQHRSPTTVTKFRDEWGTLAYTVRKTALHVMKLLQSKVSVANRLRAALHATKYFYYCTRDNLANNAPEGWRKWNPLLQVTFDGKPMKIVYFYDYIAYDPYSHIQTLKRELQWEAPDGQEIRYDCKIVSMKNFQQLLSTGMTASGFTLATLVRNGLLDREEALKREELCRTRLADDCREVAAQLKVDVEPVLTRVDRQTNRLNHR